MKAARNLSKLIVIAAAVALTLGGCSRSSKSPTAPAPLPNDPNSDAPALSCTNHFDPDTTWIEVVPQTDDVEIRNVTLSYRYDATGAWIPLASAHMVNAVVPRFTSGCIAVTGVRSLHAYAVTLWLDARRTPYRTWFHVQEE